jgi:hypothetical protein
MASAPCPAKDDRQIITDALALIFKGIAHLKNAFPRRKFTIDGRLVGDIGEIVGALEYDLILNDVSLPRHDAVTTDGRLVQIKATFKDQLTFRTTPEYYLGFKLYPDGRHDEVYNGPGNVIYERYASRKGIGSALLSFPISELRRLSASVDASARIPRRGPIPERSSLAQRDGIT